MFAQSLAEYGALASLTAAAQHTVNSAYGWVESHGAAPWILIGAIVFAVLVIRGRRTSRL